MIVPEGYEQIILDKDDCAFIVKKNGKYGAYLYNGAKLIQPCFDSMSQFTKGRSTVSARSIKGWIDLEGNLAPDFLYNMASLGIEQEKTSNAQARQTYENILEINPEYASAYNNLALMDIANKDYNKGMRKLKLAHELSPNDSVIIKNLKWAKESRKERRYERWMSGFEIAGAIIGIASTTYSTYSSIKGGDTASAGNASYPSGSSIGGSSSNSGKSHGNVGTGKCKYCAGSGTCSPSSYVSRKNSCSGSGRCGYCNGDGYNYTAGNPVKCTACNGSGKCKTCGGTGKCKHCHGSGKG